MDYEHAVTSSTKPRELVYPEDQPRTWALVNVLHIRNDLDIYYFYWRRLAKYAPGKSPKL